MVRMLTVLAALLLGAVGCARPADLEPSSPPPKTTAWAAIVDADAHGAIVLDGDQTWRGIRRDGSTAWRRPAGERDPLAVACAARCPDAVLSGSILAATRPDVRDPQPLLLLGGRSHPVAGMRSHHRRVLTAAGPTDFVAATGDRAGRWRMELHRGDRAPTLLPVGGPPTWQESPDGRVALLTVERHGGAAPGDQARWFTRQAGGWRPAGAAVPVRGRDACVAGDGRALLLGQPPAVLHRDGRQEPITDLAAAGTCSLAAAGGIVAELAQHQDGLRSRVRAVDAGGAVRWRRDLPGEVAVTADPTAPLAAYLAAGSLQEIDLRTGKALPATPGVLAARYDGAGGLVTVGLDGALAWRPADRGAGPEPPGPPAGGR